MWILCAIEKGDYRLVQEWWRDVVTYMCVMFSFVVCCNAALLTGTECRCSRECKHVTTSNVISMAAVVMFSVSFLLVALWTGLSPEMSA